MALTQRRQVLREIGDQGNYSLIGGTGVEIFEFVSIETNQTDIIQDYTAEDKLKFYVTPDESELNDSNIVNGDILWGNVTIDLAGVELASLDDLNSFMILSNTENVAWIGGGSTG